MHAFGAKPYKSLPLTRRALAQMRNKTAAAERNKKRPATKKSTSSSSLSVAQIPKRQPADRGAGPVKSASRKVVSSRERSSARRDMLKRKMDVTRRVAGRVGTTTQRKNTTSSGARYQSETVLRNRNPTGQKESGDVIRNKAALPARPATGGSIFRSGSLPRAGEAKTKNYGRQNEDKISKEQDDDDDDGEKSGEKDFKDRRLDRHTSGVRQIKIDEVAVLKEKELSTENKKSSMFLQKNVSSKSDLKGSSIPAKSLGPNEKLKEDKSTKAKDEDKSDDIDKERSRQGSEKRKAGLAEDRPKALPKKTPPSDPKKKQTDIKLEEDSLEPDIPKTNKPVAKNQGDGKLSSFNNKNASKFENPKKTSSDFNEQNFPTVAERKTALEGTSSVKNISTKGDSSENPKIKTDLKSQTSISQRSNSATSTFQSKSTSFSQTAKNRDPEKKDKDEHFYIEGQLRFDGSGINNKGVANMRITRDSEDLNKSTKKKLSSNDDNDEDGDDDTAANIWNALQAVLGSPKSTNPQSDQNTPPEEVQPTPMPELMSITPTPTPTTMPTPIALPFQTPTVLPFQTSKPIPTPSPSENNLPSSGYRTPMPESTYSENQFLKHRRGEANENIVDRGYRPDHNVRYNGYEAEYGPADDSGEEEETIYDDSEYSDSDDYDTYIPESDVAYYQNYDNRLHGGTPKYGGNRVYQQALNRDRERDDLHYGGSPYVNNFNQIQQFRIPPFTQRQLGLPMNIPLNNMMVPSTQRDYTDGRAIVVSSSTDSKQDLFNTESTNSARSHQNRENPSMDNAAAFSVVDHTAASPNDGDQTQTNALTTSLSPQMFPSPPPTPPQDNQTPESKSRYLATRDEVRSDIRDRMQHYAALSAQVNPGPVEIIPLAHDHRLEKVHTIPQ